MTKKKRAETVDQVLAEAWANPVFRLMKQKQFETRQKLQEQLDNAERPLVKALNDVGVRVNSVDDLVNTREPYPTAIHVLLEHLNKPYPERIREMIGRALAVPESRVGWKILLDTFHREPNHVDGRTGGVKWGVGLALGAAAHTAVLPDIIAIVDDPKHAEHRLTVIEALVRSNHPSARQALVRATADPMLAREIKRLKRARKR